MTVISRHASRLLGAAVLLGAALAFQPAVPAPLAAGPTCTDQYEDCINESRSKPRILREMGYIECLGEWGGCVAAKIL